MSRTRWTEQHTGSTLLAVCAAVAGAATMTDLGDARPVLLALVLLTVVLGLLLDGFLGLGVGVVTAALAALTVQRAGAWDRPHFSALATLVVALVVLGWCAGLLGASLRAQRRALERGRPADVQPAHDSLGLLPQDLGLLRLQEEVSRSERHERPLALLGVRVTPRTDVSADVAQGARRAVARYLESRLRRSDALFALGQDVAVVLPETHGAGLDEIARAIGADTRGLGVRDRGAGRVVDVASLAAVHVVTIEHTPQDDGPRALLDRLAALLDERPAHPAPSSLGAQAGRGASA